MDLTETAARQAGVIARRQALALGVGPGRVAHRVRSGRWQTLFPGVYATFTGPVPELTRTWAAVLYAGPGAAVAGRSALWLAGVEDRLVPRVQIAVPHGRKVRPQPGVDVHGRRGLDRLVHPAAVPPRLRVEEAVLDVADAAASAEQVVDVLVTATQRRLTTADRLCARLAERSRHRWRALVLDVLGEVVAGVQSVLELRYLQNVERAHGLPPGERNRAVDDADGRRRYHDVRYRRWRVVVELDGHEAHPEEGRFRDRSRDNRLTAAGEYVLRYGWHEIARDPCAVAAEVAAVLRLQGWPGRPNPCSAKCPVA